MTDPDLPMLACTTNTPNNPTFREYYVSVGRLRAMLADQPDDAVVVLAKDAEGNDYSPLSPPIATCWYVPESTWAGDVYPIGPDADSVVYQPDGSELFAVVLDPIN